MNRIAFNNDYCKYGRVFIKIQHFLIYCSTFTKMSKMIFMTSLIFGNEVFDSVYC